MDYNGNRTCIQRGNYHRMAANCSCENRTSPVEVNIPSRPVGISNVTVQTFGDIYPPQKALNVGTVFAALDNTIKYTCCFSQRMIGGANENQ